MKGWGGGVDFTFPKQPHNLGIQVCARSSATFVFEQTNVTFFSVRSLLLCYIDMEAFTSGFSMQSAYTITSHEKCLVDSFNFYEELN